MVLAAPFTDFDSKRNGCRDWLVERLKLDTSIECRLENRKWCSIASFAIRRVEDRNPERWKYHQTEVFSGIKDMIYSLFKSKTILGAF